MLDRSCLPDGETAVCVACCKNYIYSVSSSGKTYKSKIPKSGNRLNFIIVKSLQNQKITEISGTYNFCLAVREDGRVFGCGSNECGELGLGEEPRNIRKGFVEIWSLKGYKISHAYAGTGHSLFQTYDGEILACGYNLFGQLFTKPSEKCVYLPFNTGITDAKFCITGYNLSIVFIGSEPMNSPNRRIPIKSIEQLKSYQNSFTCKEIAQLRSELLNKDKRISDLEKILHFAIQQSNNHRNASTNYFIDDHEELEFHSKAIKIGEGATSFTYKVIDTRTKIPMCKKVIKWNVDQNVIKDAKKVLKEFEVMYNLTHPCICKAIGINMSEEIEIADNLGNIKKMTSIALFLEFFEHKLSDILNMNWKYIKSQNCH